MMSSAPRWAVHQALAERTPATYAARQAPAQELGMSPDMEDAAIAYRLLLEVSAGRLHDCLMRCGRMQGSRSCIALVSGAFDGCKQQGTLLMRGRTGYLREWAHSDMMAAVWRKCGRGRLVPELLRSISHPYRPT